MCSLGLSYRPKIFLSSFVRVGSAMCFLNALTIFLYGKKGGMRPPEIVFGRKLSSNYFFLAEDNATMFWTFPVLVVVWIYYFRFNKTRKMLFWAITYTIATVCSYVYMNSAAAIITTVFVAFFVLILYRSLKHNKNGKIVLGAITFNRAILVGYISSILLIFTDFISLFRNIIVEVFNKDLTLSSRIFIWQRALAHIQKSQWIGYGNENPEFTTAIIGINHTHNLILEILYRGGIIGLILFSFALFYCGRVSLRSKGKILYIFLCGTLATFFLSLSVEFGFYRYPYVILLVLALHTELHDSAFDNLHSIVTPPNDKLKRKAEYTGDN